MSLQAKTDEITELRKEIESLRHQVQIMKRTKGAVDPGILDAVITNIGTGYVVSDIEGNIIYQNDAAQRMHDFRYEEEELANLEEYKRVFRLEYPEGGVVPFDQWPLSLAIRGDYFRDYVLKMINPVSRSRKVRFISYNTVPIYDNNGVKRYIVITMTDLSDIREKTEELHESRLRYQSLFNNTSLGMAHCRIITDESGTPVDYMIIQINEAYSKISGLRKSDLEGKYATEVYPGIRNYSFDFVANYGRIALQGGEINEEIFDERFNKFILLYAYSPIKGEFTSIFTDITPRKEMEDKLTRERALFEGIFNNIPVMITVYDPGLKEFRLNRELTNVLGWTEQDTKDGRFMEKVYPDPDYRKEVSTYMSSLEEGWKEFWPVSMGGTPVCSSWANIRLTSGIQIGIGIDIRQRREAEETLRKNEQRFRGIFSNVAIGIVEVDSESRIVSVNDRICEILDYKREELLGKTVLDITYPEDHELSREINNKIYTGKAGIVDYEKRYVKSDGTPIWVHVTISGVYDENGRHNHSIGTVEDITIRKIVEQDLRENEEKFRSVFENVVEAIALHNVIYEDGRPADFTVIDTNRAFRENFGIMSEELRGKPAKEIYLSRGLPVIDEFYEVADKQKPHKFEVRLDSNKYFIINLISPRKGQFVTVFDDITDQKKNEIEIRKKNEELTRFIYTVSHDLKSPLVTIKSFSNYLQEDIAANDAVAQERDLNFIRNAADRMARLLDELLELSRIGRKEAPIGQMSLEEIVRTAADLVAGRLEARQIRVKITGVPVMLNGHIQRFIQLYQNLIDNSAKFMGDQPEPVIEAGAYLDENNQPILFVRDNGTGIDPRYHHKIFGLFEKMDAGTEGTGIGLALVKRIVEVHGGSIWFASEGSGKGTTFYLKLEGTTIIK